jgi:hypothetical protein
MAKRPEPAIVRVCVPDEEAKAAALKLLIERTSANVGRAPNTNKSDERSPTTDR